MIVAYFRAFCDFCLFDQTASIIIIICLLGKFARQNTLYIPTKVFSAKFSIFATEYVANAFSFEIYGKWLYYVCFNHL